VRALMPGVKSAEEGRVFLTRECARDGMAAALCVVPAQCAGTVDATGVPGVT
jgi:hypothetical protein